MNENYLSKLLIRPGSLFITAEGYAAAMMDCFPVNPVSGAFLIEQDPPTYRELATKALKQLQQSVHSNSEESITLSDEFESDQIPDNSIAYHRIFGIVTSSCRWYFSSKQFEQDLLSAEANPAISCHFLHINTPGGEAWYLDQLSKTMRTIQKPVVTLIERCCCSAGYYIACHSSHIYALTQNDDIGCIGTMIDFYDFEAYYEKLGFKHIKYHAEQSDLKNKKFDDLRSGKPEQYIKEDLNPLAEQFISEVKQCRAKLQELPEDDPIFRGETFNTTASISNGLVDEQASFLEVVIKAHQLGKEYAATEELKKRALKFL